MNDLDRRLATLASLFASERAPALLSRLATGGDAGVATHARDLSNLPRRQRLRALATVVAVDGAAARAAAEAAASTERARIATILRALGADLAVPGAAPIVLRICRQRIGR